MRRHLILSTFVAAFVALIFTSAASAQPGRGGGRPGSGNDVWERLSGRYDANQDGQITKDEFDGGAEVFATLDANSDGVLTAADVSGRGHGARTRGPRQRGLMGGGFIVRMADADRDRAVTAGEWQDFLAGIDPNGDGVIESEESSAFFSERFGGTTPHSSPSGGTAHPPREGATRSFSFDRDGDGVFETEDLQAAFDGLDDDGDQSLSSDELPDVPGRGRGRMGGGGGFGGMILAHLADVDEDREVTRGEWDGLVAQIDADDDGVIGTEELTAALPRRGTDDGLPERPEGAGAQRGDRSEMFARGLDRDGDGTLETGDLTALFDELDRDGSDAIEQGELFRRRQRQHP